MLLLCLSLERDKEPAAGTAPALGGKRRGCRRGAGGQQTRVREAQGGLIPSPSSDLLLTALSPPSLTSCPNPPNYSPPSPCPSIVPTLALPTPNPKTPEGSQSLPAPQPRCGQQRHWGMCVGVCASPQKINMGRG